MTWPMGARSPQAHDVLPSPEGAASQGEQSPVLSVVVPVFNEEDCLERFHHELSAALGSMVEPCEVVYVDDGSSYR